MGVARGREPVFGLGGLAEFITSVLLLYTVKQYLIHLIIKEEEKRHI